MLLNKAGTTLYGYPSASGTVTVSGITSIGDLAFEGCTNLISVSSPDVVSIESGAFAACTSLTSASFPNASSIRGSTFDGCTGLTSVSFPQATSIGRQAFHRCTSLSTASFPQATFIDQFAFANTGGIALTITLGSTPPMIYYESFGDGLDVPKTVTVRVPSGAEAAYDTTWQNRFTGGTTNINLTIQGY
jgi:hypothetical protein